MTKISFIGGGNMARALIGGLQSNGYAMDAISVIEPDADKRQQLHAEYGVHVTEQLPSVSSADVIVLAVKPQQLRDLAIFLGSLLHGQLVISIAAGIRSQDLARWLGGYQAIVRVMPNTPAQIQAGISALYALPAVSAAQKDIADTIMQAAGKTVWLDAEQKMDAVTAISGSGPAYVFYFIEAMQQAALELGLSAEDARLLSLQTFAGATALAAQSSETPATLRAQVTSKGGTTERALLSMDTAGVKNAIIQAAHAAAARSAELGDQLGKE
ncbi:pyrroline-5-carboxylate reductase [Methylovorus glucosotrophus]|uniref:pyrroline-5-carboxylate reductase n=1 Tax=Methylovorus glucosotrophus TaxID=266009 RepID=UPI00133163A7|nr:pyrroline-5-carboxylate reductase [Methylovorus glucosotrophus]KAF0836479.1 pyrroline-5-carboxylate reductase [Methylovorus glucosotrophus]